MSDHAPHEEYVKAVSSGFVSRCAALSWARGRVVTPQRLWPALRARGGFEALLASSEDELSSELKSKDLARAVLSGQSAGEFQAKAIAKLKPQIAWAKVANVAFVNATAQRVTSAVARVAPWAVPGIARFVLNRTRLRI